MLIVHLVGKVNTDSLFASSPGQAMPHFDQGLPIKCGRLNLFISIDPPKACFTLTVGPRSGLAVIVFEVQHHGL